MSGRAPDRPVPGDGGGLLRESGAGDDPLPAFAAAFRAESEMLGTPANLYLVHAQTAPRRFVDWTRRRAAPRRFFEARMFAFDFADPTFGDCERCVLSDGTLCPSAVYPGTRLDPNDAARAAEILHAAPAAWARRARVRCFEPHHAVVFFDGRGMPVAEVTLCFECNNFKLRPGPSDEAEMTPDEALFFAELCRTLHVGGCPPPGSSRLPDLPPPPESALSPDESRHLRVRRALSRAHGVPPGRRLTELADKEREVVCLWLGSALRFATNGVWLLECRDGRRIVGDDDCTRRAAAPCAGTVGDFAACARSRLDPVCGTDAPECARTDACRWGLFQEP